MNSNWSKLPKSVFACMLTGVIANHAVNLNTIHAAKKSSKKFEGYLITSSSNLIDKSALLELTSLKPRSKWKPWRKKTDFDQQIIAEDLKKMTRKMEIDGFYDSEIKSTTVSTKEADHFMVDVDVKTGPIAITQNIDIDLPSNESFNIHQVIDNIPLKANESFSETKFQASREWILTELLNTGHYWAEVTPLAQLDQKNSIAKVKYKIIPGPRTQFGKTEIKGNFGISKSLILREFQHQEGEVFDLGKLMSTRTKLVATRWFRSVVITPDPKAQKGAVSVPITMELIEAEPRTIGIGLGMGSEVGPRAKVSWQHRNYTGRGWNNKVHLEASQIDVRLKSSLNIPYAWSPYGKLRFDASYQFETEEDYDLYLGEVSGAWSHPWRRSSIELGFVGKHQIHESDLSLRQSLGSPSEQSLLFGPKLSISRSLALFSKGPKVALASDIEILNDMADKGSALWRYQISARSQQTLPWDWMSFQKIKLGWADHLSGKSMPVSERYYTGGSGKVRGYSRRNIGPRNLQGDRLGGLSLWQWSQEFQHELLGVENLMGALFLDAGQLDLSTNGLQMSEFRYGYGFGVGYKLPMGVAKLDFGFPANPKPWDSNFQIHFDFGASL
jgi:translocation and assembly module TamA